MEGYIDRLVKKYCKNENNLFVYKEKKQKAGRSLNNMIFLRQMISFVNTLNGSLTFFNYPVPVNYYYFLNLCIYQDLCLLC